MIDLRKKLSLHTGRTKLAIVIMRNLFEIRSQILGRKNNVKTRRGLTIEVTTTSRIGTNAMTGNVT